MTTYGVVAENKTRETFFKTMIILRHIKKEKLSYNHCNMYQVVDQKCHQKD